MIPPKPSRLVIDEMEKRKNTYMPNTPFFKSLYPQKEISEEESTDLKISTVHTAKYKIFQPKYLSKLQTTKGIIHYFTYKKPNIWLRFWQYILLGWEWEGFK